MIKENGFILIFKVWQSCHLFLAKVKSLSVLSENEALRTPLLDVSFENIKRSIRNMLPVKIFGDKINKLCKNSLICDTCLQQKTCNQLSSVAEFDLLSILKRIKKTKNNPVTNSFKVKNCRTVQYNTDTNAEVSQGFPNIHNSCLFENPCILAVNYCCKALGVRCLQEPWLLSSPIKFEKKKK